MYEQYFNLNERPFLAAARVDRYFPAGAIEEARQRLTRCIERAEGIAMLVGPPGTGKSLLCQVLAEQCKEMFKQRGNKKYHSTACKDDHHNKNNALGEQAANRGTIHAAKLENSDDRLIPIAKIMADGKEYTPMQIDDRLRELSPPIY